MYNEGYHSITNIDYSDVVIEKMKARHWDKPSMKWQVMDINYMNFGPKKFDCIIEKGTLDALLVTEKNPWLMSEEGETAMDNILKKVKLFNCCIIAEIIN